MCQSAGIVNENQRIFSGLAPLDTITGGIRRGEFMLLAGRPAMGHEQMLDAAFLHNSLERHLHVGRYLFHESWEACFRRLCLGLAGVGFRELVSRAIDPEGREQLARIAERLDGMELTCAHCTRPSLEYVSSLFGSHAHPGAATAFHSPDVIFIDELGALRAGRRLVRLRDSVPTLARAAADSGRAVFAVATLPGTDGTQPVEPPRPADCIPGLAARAACTWLVLVHRPVIYDPAANEDEVRFRCYHHGHSAGEGVLRWRALRPLLDG